MGAATDEVRRALDRARSLGVETVLCADCGAETPRIEALFGPPIPEFGGRSDAYCPRCGEERDDVSARARGMTRGELGTFFDLW